MSAVGFSGTTSSSRLWITYSGMRHSTSAESSGGRPATMSAAAKRSWCRAASAHVPMPPML